MVWAQKALAAVLTVLLVISLLGTAFSASTDLELGRQQKVENWLNQSDLYQHFLTNAITQAKKSAGSSEAQGSVTLSDSAVQQAASSAFSSQLFQTSLNTFLSSNYSWLEGHTPQPNFTIDLTGAKQSFADQIAQYVSAHISSLPVCSPQQLAEIGSSSNVDPLNITCRPPTLDVKAEANLVAQKVSDSQSFLSNPVITANNVNPNGGSTQQPYYQKFSKAPALYQAMVKMPWLYAAIALVSALAIVALLPGRRRGLRRVAVSLLAAGVILVLVPLAANSILNQLENKIFNRTNVGQLQQSLTNFLSLAEHQIAKINLYFGITYLVLAVLILMILALKKRRPNKPNGAPIPASDSSSIADRLRDTPHQPNPRPPEPLRPPQAEEPTAPPPPPKRPPRLIQ